MVRILKVKELEDRRRVLLTRSEMYRQTLKLEIANVKFSAALMKRRLKIGRNALLILGSTLPLAGGLFAARKPISRASGLLPKVVVGLKLFNRFAPLLKKIHERRREAAAGARQRQAEFSNRL